MKSLVALLFGAHSQETPVIKHLPIQTEGQDADARRARRDIKIQECIDKMGKKYRLHGRIQKGTHRLADPKAPPANVRHLKLGRGG